MELIRGMCTICSNTANKVLKQEQAKGPIDQLKSIFKTGYNPSCFQSLKSSFKVCPTCCFHLQLISTMMECASVKPKETNGGNECVLCRSCVNVILIEADWKYFHNRLEAFYSIEKNKPVMVCSQCYFAVDTAFNMKNNLFNKFPVLKKSSLSRRPSILQEPKDKDKKETDFKVPLKTTIKISNTVDKQRRYSIQEPGPASSSKRRSSLSPKVLRKLTPKATPSPNTRKNRSRLPYKATDKNLDKTPNKLSLSAEDLKPILKPLTRRLKPLSKHSSFSEEVIESDYKMYGQVPYVLIERVKVSTSDLPYKVAPKHRNPFKIKFREAKASPTRGKGGRGGVKEFEIASDSEENTPVEIVKSVNKDIVVRLTRMRSEMDSEEGSSLISKNNGKTPTTDDSKTLNSPWLKKELRDIVKKYTDVEKVFSNTDLREINENGIVEETMETNQESNVEAIEESKNGSEETLIQNGNVENAIDAELVEKEGKVDEVAITKDGDHVPINLCDTKSDEDLQSQDSEAEEIRIIEDATATETVEGTKDTEKDDKLEETVTIEDSDKDSDQDSDHEEKKSDLEQTENEKSVVEIDTEEGKDSDQIDKDEVVAQTEKVVETEPTANANSEEPKETTQVNDQTEGSVNEDFGSLIDEVAKCLSKTTDDSEDYLELHDSGETMGLDFENVVEKEAVKIDVEDIDEEEGRGRKRRLSEVEDLTAQDRKDKKKVRFNDTVESFELSE